MALPKSSFVTADDLGIPQLTEKQLKEIAKKLSKEAENKSSKEIEFEVAQCLASNTPRFTQY
jgi:hypothetical protein